MCVIHSGILFFFLLVHLHRTMSTASAENHYYQCSNHQSSFDEECTFGDSAECLNCLSRAFVDYSISNEVSDQDICDRAEETCKDYAECLCTDKCLQSSQNLIECIMESSVCEIHCENGSGKILFC